MGNILKMALRGNSPKPDPRGQRPQWGCYFEGERCPKCRYRRGDLDERDRERRRSPKKQANRFLSLFSNIFTTLNLTDMETASKALKHEVLQQLTLNEDHFGFGPETTANVGSSH